MQQSNRSGSRRHDGDPNRKRFERNPRKPERSGRPERDGRPVRRDGPADNLGRTFRAGTVRGPERVMPGKPAEPEKTRADIQKRDPMELMRSVQNLGPGAGVWTRVNSILKSEVTPGETLSIAAGFEDRPVVMHYSPESEADVAMRIQRIRWYEKS